MDGYVLRRLADIAIEEDVLMAPFYRLSDPEPDDLVDLDGL